MAMMGQEDAMAMQGMQPGMDPGMEPGMQPGMGYDEPY